MESIKRTKVLKTGWKGMAAALIMLLTITSQAAAVTPNLDLMRLFTQESVK